MAKKVVATLQTGEGRSWSKVIKMVRSEKTGAYVGRSWSKVIKMVRSEKTGAYVFEERMVPNDKVQDWLK